MSCEFNEDRTMVVCGNFAELLSQKPKDRKTIGKTTCDCNQIETHYAPWYGFTWYHSKECALLKRVKERPGLKNLWCFDDVETIGHSE